MNRSSHVYGMGCSRFDFVKLPILGPGMVVAPLIPALGDRSRWISDFKASVSYVVPRQPGLQNRKLVSNNKVYLVLEVKEEKIQDPSDVSQVCGRWR